MADRKMEKQKLVFVYNADSGVFNLLTDIAHKIFSPETYSCNLCALTHSNFGMKKKWKNFLESLDLEKEFLHADEFKEKFNLQEVALPAVYRQDDDGNIEIIINALEIKKCRTIDDLILYFNSRIQL